MSKCHLSRSLDKRVPWEMNIPPWEVVGWLGGFLQLARPLGDSDVRQMLLGMVVKKADCSPGWCGSAVANLSARGEAARQLLHKKCGLNREPENAEHAWHAPCWPLGSLSWTLHQDG